MEIDPNIRHIKSQYFDEQGISLDLYIIIFNIILLNSLSPWFEVFVMNKMNMIGDMTDHRHFWRNLL